MELNHILTALTLTYVAGMLVCFALGAAMRLTGGGITWAQVAKASLVWPRVIYHAIRGG